MVSACMVVRLRTPPSYVLWNSPVGIPRHPSRLFVSWTQGPLFLVNPTTSCNPYVRHGICGPYGSSAHRFVRFGGCPHLDASENSGTPKSSILIGFSIINHPFSGTPIFGNTHLDPWNFSHTLETKWGKIIDYRFVTKETRDFLPLSIAKSWLGRTQGRLTYNEWLIFMVNDSYK